MSDVNREELFKQRIERQKNLDDLYHSVFSSEEGRIILEDLMMFSGMYDPCFGKDNNETNKMLGSRTVGLYINDRINHKFSKLTERQADVNKKGADNGKERR